MPGKLVQEMEIGRRVPPVIENPKLSQMTEKPPRQRRIAGKIELMSTEPKPDAGKQGRMKSMKDSSARPPRPTSGRDLPEMQSGKQPAPPGNDGYVRLTLRVTGDKVAIVGAKAVEGPLVERTQLHGALAYDVSIGSKRIALGSLPDAGERRSFANPDPKAPPEQRGHYISEIPAYDVAVRVPASELTLAALPRVNIRLYRLKEPVDATQVKPGPLGEQFERELREVARVPGIKLDELPAPHREELRKALG